MTDDKKLPMSLQLVGLTAVVVFCFSAIAVFNYSRALWQAWAMFVSVTATNKVELFFPIVRAAFLCIASAAMFFVLLRATLLTATRVAIGYLSVLLLLQGWLLLSWWLSVGQWHFGHRDLTFLLALGTKLVYLAWPLGLLIKVWPNYSFKRTGAERLR